MCDTAKMTDIIMTDNTECQLYGNIPVRYIHSNSRLTKSFYKFVGEIKIEDLTGKETIVVLDAFAYRQRHKDTGRIIRLRTGGYVKGDDYVQLKVVAVVDTRGRLFALTEKSNRKVADIAPRTPIRQAGIYGAMKRVKRTTENTQGELFKSA